MKSEKTNLLGFDITVNVASTLAEAANLAGSEERILDLANKQILAHSHFTKLRRAITGLVEKETGIRMAEGEKEREFIFRVKEERGDETLNMLRAAVNEISGNIPVDYKVGARNATKVRVPAKRWLTGVDELKAAGKYERFIERYGVTFEGNETEEEVRYIVAAKLRDVVLEEEREAKISIFEKIM